ncbi:transcriptional regulator [Halobacterium sp. PCN9]|uniref:Transcriptional regulator n=2 Tax=Halobacterium bonnevillei TaxID=2692200 RepID=A0A6B0SHW2_9EURY|nr:transcriptional regulator [Halobacterium bonnevillei]
MVPLDDEILEVLYSTRLVLTPAVIAYNIEYSREEVNRRLRRLESEGMVERVQRGKYQLSERGKRYVDGHPVSGESN